MIHDNGYPFGQLLKALAGTGEKAATRAQRWRDVLGGIAKGTLRVGSRTPVANTPAWVTLEVLHGGFATGHFSAGGPLRPHETAWLDALSPRAHAADRTALNLHFLDDAGNCELGAMLATGRFRIEVPEEGALLVVHWLLRHGEAERAGTVLETLVPFFDRLRFYPVPHPHPYLAGEGAGICMHTAGEVVAGLRAKKPRGALARMHETLRVWNPLYDRAVALFLETVEGDEGWPCRRYPADWNERAHALLEDYRAARKVHTLCRKPEKRKENFARLRHYMEILLADPAALTGSDVGMIRKILASFVTSHGEPGSRRWQDTRNAQARMLARPTHAAIATVLATRIEPYPEDEGIAQIDELLVPLTETEASRIGGAAGEAIPKPLAAKAGRCLEAPVDSLVERGLVTSSETIARLVPSVTARVRATAISDPELQRIYQAVYRAFRRRRSLLLLNLESQVKLHELPWMAALAPWTVSDESSRAASRETLVHIAGLALRAFPYTIVPNKLLQELRSLAAGAGLSLPWVDELAADIFMGAFSENFTRAAKLSARSLEGSLYARYYGIPYDDVASLGDDETRRFLALCEERARARSGDTWTVARNGTTGMARRSFAWICRRQQMMLRDWHAQLTMMKNTAYAWRQMLFYLSRLDRAAESAFLEWGSTHLAKQRLDFRGRFEPVWAGLQAVAGGYHFNEDGIHSASGGRRFLGWSIGKHWLVP